MLRNMSSSANNSLLARDDTAVIRSSSGEGSSEDDADSDEEDRDEDESDVDIVGDQPTVYRT